MSISDCHNFFKDGKYDTRIQARVFSIRLKKYLNPRLGQVCNATYPVLNLSEVTHRLLTHALDDLESRNGNSRELHEIKSAMLQAKELHHPAMDMTQKLNHSLNRLKRVAKP